MDQNTKSDGEQHGTGHNKGLQLTHSHDDESKGGAGEDGGKAVQRGDAGGAENGFVEAHKEHGVQKVTLEIPRCYSSS